MQYCVIFDTVQQYCGFIRLCGSRFLPIWKILMRHCSILLSVCAVFRFSEAARAARLFFLIQPIKSLISGVVVVVAVVIS